MKHKCPICNQLITAHDLSCYNYNHYYMLVIKNDKFYREKAFFDDFLIRVEYDVYPQGTSDIYFNNYPKISGKSFLENRIIYHPDYLKNLLILQ